MPVRAAALTALQSTILANLRDPDVSIRRRALDLLFTMCDGGAAVEVVEELVRGADGSERVLCSELLVRWHRRMHGCRRYLSPGACC